MGRPPRAAVATPPGGARSECEPCQARYRAESRPRRSSSPGRTRGAAPRAGGPAAARARAPAGSFRQPAQGRPPGRDDRLPPPAPTAGVRWLPFARRLLEPEAADGRPDPEAVLVRADETIRLARAPARLPARQREGLHLGFYRDLTIAEAATLLGIALGTARTHYERGQAALRPLLEEADR